MSKASNSRILIAGLVTLASAAPSLTRAATIGTAGGYTFINFDRPNSGNAAGAGTTSNGIANSGAVVGFSTDNAGNFTNFVRNPDGTFTTLNSLNNPNTGMANGINTVGDVVGQLNSNAVALPHGGSPQTLPLPTNVGSTAFGINDNGNIVGQFTTASDTTPGFFVANAAGNNFVRIDAPSGPDAVNAQGSNNHGIEVGFYVGADGQDHGFMANLSLAHNGQLTGTPITDPTIPSVPGEPGATFVFSQILGVNDNGLAVGYYGDSTTSQHGFFYNLNTGQYTFLDDPAEQFNNGVEVTQITGINNSDDITGFYSDASGVFHGFLACPAGSACPAASPAAVPEPGSLLLASFGFVAPGLGCFRRRRTCLAQQS